jgi:hypothetical protein
MGLIESQMKNTRMMITTISVVVFGDRFFGDIDIGFLVRK